MNNLMTPSTLSMTSREIAEVTGYEHRHVTRQVRTMLKELKIDAISVEGTYKDAHNCDQTEYFLDKELTLTLASGYSITQRNAIVNRWQELEGQHQPMTIGDTLVAQAKAFRAMERQLALVQEKQSETSTLLGQTAGEHFTIINWSRLHGKAVTSSMASAMDGHATKYCQDNGIPTGSVPHPKFWRVNKYKYLNTYPKHVLDFLFTGLSEHSL